MDILESMDVFIEKEHKITLNSLNADVLKGEAEKKLKDGKLWLSFQGLENSLDFLEFMENLSMIVQEEKPNFVWLDFAATLNEEELRAFENAIFNNLADDARVFLTSKDKFGDIPLKVFSEWLTQDYPILSLEFDDENFVDGFVKGVTSNKTLEHLSSSVQRKLVRDVLRNEGNIKRLEIKESQFTYWPADKSINTVSSLAAKHLDLKTEVTVQKDRFIVGLEWKSSYLRFQFWEYFCPEAIPVQDFYAVLKAQLPRYEEMITKKEKRSFPNLVLKTIAKKAITQNVSHSLKNLTLVGNVNLSEEVLSSEVDEAASILLGNNQLIHFETDCIPENLPAVSALKDEVIKRALTKKISKAIETGQKVRYNRSRLMFIGAGGAGKTSTIRSLLGKSFQADLKSTIVGKGDIQVKVSTFNMSHWKEIETCQGRHLLDGDFARVLSRLKGQKQFDKVDTSKKVTKAPRQAQKNKENKSMNRGFGRILSKMSFLAQRRTQTSFQKREQIKDSSISLSPFVSLYADAEKRRERQEQINDEGVLLSVFDFAGQTLFHSLHHLFLTDNGIYLLLFNIVAMLDNAKQEIKSLRFWIESLRLHAKDAPVLIIGTRCTEVSPVDIEKVAKILNVFLRNFKEIKILTDHDNGLPFYPIDNALGNKNEPYLLPVRHKIEFIFSDKNRECKVHGFNTRIKAAWSFYLNYLVLKQKSHHPIDDLKQDSRILGFPENELHEMLIFFTEVGTILYFGRNGIDISTSLSSYVVLQMQWLLNALGAITYDVDVHDSKVNKVPSNLREDVIEYEDHGILTFKLLKHLWRRYEEPEQRFLLAINLQMCLISVYGLCPHENADDHPRQSYLVPTMLKITCETFEKYLPPQEDQLKIYLQFNQYLPVGLFERVLCIFIQKNFQLEGTRKPIIFQGACVVFFPDVKVCLLLSQSMNYIEVVLSTDYADKVSTIAQFLRSTNRILQRDVFGKKFSGTITLGAKNDSLNVCALDDLIKAKERGDRGVLLYNSGETVPVTFFSHFKTIIMKDKTTIQCKTVQHKYIWDCFLAHEWGTKKDNFNAHRRVIEISRMLRKKGLKVWIDKDSLKNDVARDIMHGLVNSQKVVVFLTRRYLERSDDAETNCAKELTSAVKKGIHNILVVLLEPGLNDPTTWYGTTFDYHLGHLKSVDFSTDALIKRNFDELVYLIRNA